MNISTDCAFSQQVNYTPNFKAFVLKKAGRRELEELASGENLRKSLKLKEDPNKKGFFEAVRILIHNNLFELLQLKELSKESQSFDIVCDAEITGVSRKNEDIVFRAPFKIFNNCIDGAVSKLPGYANLAVLPEAVASALKEKIEPYGDKIKMYNNDVLAHVFGAIENISVDDFESGSMLEEDYTEETSKKIEAEIQEYARKLLED